MKKFNMKAAAAAGLIVVLVAGGTFAYYNQSMSLDNPLSTGSYESYLVEEYTPETDELIPGTTLSKEVGAVNTGDYPVLVRIKMDEKWATGSNAELISLSSEDDYDVFEASTSNASPYVTSQQLDDTDGLVDGDGSVVRKNLDTNNLANWVYGGDGYWYYNGVLAANGGETGNLLKSITLASNIDLGNYIEKDYYYVGTSQPAANSTDWIEYWVTRDSDGLVTDIELTSGTSIGDLNKDGLINAIDMTMALSLKDGEKLFRKNESLLDESATGYADATYTLVVTSEFVQASSDAVLDAWGYDADDMNTLIGITADSDGIYQ